MERAGDLLARVARQLRRPEAPVAWLASSWPGIVGKTIAAHARPVRCKEGRLEITVDGTVWQRELENMSRDLCDRINSAWGGKLVREVTLVIAARNVGDESDASAPKKYGRRTVPHELDNNHTPFMRRRK